MIKPGNVVTDIDPESRFEGKQGEVEDVQCCLWDPPEILVRFDRFLESSFLSRREEDEKFVRFIYEEHELHVDTDWAPEMYARRKFGSKFHSICTCSHPLDTTALCMVDECPYNQEKIVWINIWGTVLNVYVCTRHAKFYEVYSCGDSFPWRRDRGVQKVSA